MQSVTRLTIFLCCVWAASLLYGEMIAFWVPLWSCSWPRPHPQDSSSTAHEVLKGQVNIAVIADPQLMDMTSLRLASGSFVLEAAKFYTDLYMRRSYLASILPFKPDMILFLGDQFDGGPLLSDIEWQASLNRFKHIFDLNGKGKYSNNEVHYLSGNHDIGYSGFHSLYEKVITRYEKEFGQRNYRFNVQNVDFVVVDAQTLDGPVQGNLALNSWEFIKNVSREASSSPRVLLTHIPLYRPDDTPCGPDRSSPIINQRVSYAGVNRGISYQNYLTEETSRRLLDLIRPVIVLSGHDHDQCTIVHSTSFGQVTEHTLGTVSWQQGNLYPSFMLFSVRASQSTNSTNQEPPVSTHLCFLPMQTHIYIWYVILFVITIIVVMFWPATGLGCWKCINYWISCCKEAIKSSFRATKLKDEDENCEYEMVWDAEGSMHLVKKAVPRAIPTASSDIGLTGRGGITVRPQARRHTAQEEACTSVTLAVNLGAKSEDVGKSTQSSNSKVTKVVKRLVRVVRLLTIIAAVNAPLYMIILFKDWIGQLPGQV